MEHIQRVLGAAPITRVYGAAPALNGWAEMRLIEMSQDGGSCSASAQFNSRIAQLFTDEPDDLREYQLGVEYVRSIYDDAVACWIQTDAYSTREFKYLMPRRMPSQLLWQRRDRWGGATSHDRRIIRMHYQMLIGIDTQAFGDVADLIDYLIDYGIIEQERDAAGHPNDGSERNAIENHSKTTEQPSEIEKLEAQVASLGAIARTHAQIELLNGELRANVEEARQASVSWGRIGRTLGITSQAAMRRYDDEARAKHLGYSRKDN